jgi:ribosomal protein S27E
MIDIPCPGCDQTYHADEGHAEREFQCLTCGRRLRVPSTGHYPVASAGAVPRSPGHAASAAPDGRRTRRTRPWWIPAVAVGSLVGLAVMALLMSGRTGITAVPEPGWEDRPRAPLAPYDLAADRSPTLSTPFSSFGSTLERAASCLRPHPDSLPNGQDIVTPRGPSGLGTLRVENGTTRDAVVKVIDAGSRETYRLTYVRARSDTTLRNLGPGTLRLQFALGADWDAFAEKFRCTPSYSEFVDPLVFVERPLPDETIFSTFTVTLHPVPEGKARTRALDEATFYGRESTTRAAEPAGPVGHTRSTARRPSAGSRQNNSR